LSALKKRVSTLSSEALHKQLIAEVAEPEPVEAQAQSSPEHTISHWLSFVLSLRRYHVVWGAVAVWPAMLSGRDIVAIDPPSYVWIQRVEASKTQLLR
jgi:hypothetical protein